MQRAGAEEELVRETGSDGGGHLLIGIGGEIVTMRWEGKLTSENLTSAETSRESEVVTWLPQVYPMNCRYLNG